MKDDEIIKALSLCAESSSDISKCEQCPLFGDYSHCRDELIKLSNELVKRLVVRTERLKTKNKRLKRSEVYKNGK